MTLIALCLWAAAGTAVPPPVLFPGADAQRANAVHRALIAGTPDVVAIGADEPRPSTATALPAELLALKTRAETAYDEADLATAADAGRKLVSGIERQLDRIGDVLHLIDARLVLASTYIALEEGLLARAELDAVARMRPALDLDLKRWPPALVEAFDQAKVRVQAEPAAELTLSSQPVGAVVFVDGVRLGTSPAVASVKKGPHLLWIGATGHKATARVIHVEAGSKIVIDDALMAEPLGTSLGALRAELLREGRRDDALRLARAFATDAGADAVIVSALTPDGVLLLANVAANAVNAGAIRLPADAVDAAVIELAQAPRVDDSLASALDFDAHLLGRAPQARVAAEESVLASPWTWGAIGAGALVVAGTAITAAVLFNQPVVQTGAPQTRIVVVAAQ